MSPEGSLDNIDILSRRYYWCSICIVMYQSTLESLTFFVIQRSYLHGTPYGNKQTVKKVLVSPPIIIYYYSD